MAYVQHADKALFVYTAQNENGKFQTTDYFYVNREKMSEAEVIKKAKEVLAKKTDGLKVTSFMIPNNEKGTFSSVK